jgi:lysosomal Pro-X carboxypeptidase
MPICSNGISDMFENQPWNFQEFSDYCFTEWNVRPCIEWPFMEFGGQNLTDLRYYSNIIFTNGNLDPWSSGGINSTITSSLPSILITGGAHHLDLRSANKDDPESVIKARQEIVTLIQQWIL